MDGSARRETLQIKKYPNRRYYDATRSCHVTLKGMHDLIRSGYDVTVIDSRSGHDITNVVLLQVILEKDHPKLDLFPSAILHFMIRSNPQALRTYSEQVLGPLMNMMAASGKQFDAYLREIMHTGIASSGSTSPMDWANMMMVPFTRGWGRDNAEQPSADGKPTTTGNAPPPVGVSANEPADTIDGETAAELRSQLAELSRRIKDLTEDRSSKPSEGV